MNKLLFVAAMAVLLLPLVNAAQIAMGDPCYVLNPRDGHVVVTFETDTLEGLVLENTCEDSQIDFEDNVTLVLGPILAGEVVQTKTSIFVDSVVRPDLDVPARLTFKRTLFTVTPEVLKNGIPCNAPDCVVSFDGNLRNVYVDVQGFSNYSLTSRKDFVVQSDVQPELDTKTYQTIDLGDANRDEVFACIVQLYGFNEQSQYVLVQTNPERSVQGKILGNPDPNQPESLGYFPTVNGMANVYFRDVNIAGYNDFLYVAQCTSNSTKLVYEESISTRYRPMGRNVVGRGVWFTSGSNAVYLVAEIIAVALLVFIGLAAIRRLRR